MYAEFWRDFAVIFNEPDKTEAIQVQLNFADSD